MQTDPVKMMSEAIKNHTIWLENVNKSLICDISPTDTMIDKESYLKCEFGKWLEENKEVLKDINLALFYEVYEEHKKLHEIAKEILDIAYENNFLNIKIHKTIPERKYDELLKISKDIKKTLRKFRANLYDSNI